MQKDRTPEERDGMINDGPPRDLIHLFRTVPTNERIRLDRAQHQIVVARNVNDSHIAEVSRMRITLTAIKSTAQILIQQISELELRMEAWELNATGTERLIEAVDTSLDPVETELSSRYADEVSDREDFDHMDE
jgi:hypothetical protein